MRYDVQFADPATPESRARIIAEGWAGGSARCSHVWRLDGALCARVEVPPEHDGYLRADLGADARVSGYAPSRI